MHMETSLYIAQLLSPILFFGGIAILAKREELRRSVEDYVGNSTFVFVTSLLAMLIGLNFVVQQRVWDDTWETVITLIGWLILTKAMIVMFMPNDVLRKVVRHFNRPENYVIKGVAWIVLGAYLAMLGYGM